MADSPVPSPSKGPLATPSKGPMTGGRSDSQFDSSGVDAYRKGLGRENGPLTPSPDK